MVPTLGLLIIGVVTVGTLGCRSAKKADPDAATQYDACAAAVADAHSDISADRSDVRLDVRRTPDAAGISDAGGDAAGGRPGAFPSASCGVTTTQGSSGTVDWAETLGGSSPGAVAIDPSTGAVVLAGNITVAQGNAATSSGQIVVEFDANGSYRWAKGASSSARFGVQAAAVDGVGNVVVVGTFAGTLDLGGASLASVGNWDIFLFELDSTGTYLWGKTFGAPGKVQAPSGLGVDKSGSVLLLSKVDGADLGGGALTGTYLTKFDSTGGLLWSRALPPPDTMTAYALAVDQEGSSIAGGRLDLATSTADFGGGALTSSAGGNRPAVLAKFDLSGAYQWAKAYGYDATVRAVATDTQGNVFAFGDTYGHTDFGSGPIDNSGHAPFLAKIDAAGGGVWAQFFPFTDVDYMEAGLAVDEGGRPWVALNMKSGIHTCVPCPPPGRTEIDFGCGVLRISEDSSAVASFDAAGKIRWAHAFSQSFSGWPPLIAVDSSGLILAGASRPLLVLPGGDTLTNLGSSETSAFLLSLFP